MEPAFKFYFNRHKQFISVFLYDVHPNTFKTIHDGGRWGYFLPTWEKKRKGKFGELHLVKSRVREDLIVHELDHARFEWMKIRDIQRTDKNEEHLCSLLDEMFRHCWVEWKKYCRLTGYK